MRFIIKLRLISDEKSISLNYPYLLSSAIYKIIAKGDAEYAKFLHGEGYGKNFKLFTFSQLSTPFKIEKGRMILSSCDANLTITFHLPRAAENFVKGLFQSQQIELADNVSKTIFKIYSVENLTDPLCSFQPNELISIKLKPLSPIVVGVPNEKRNYDFLSPDESKFIECVLYNWRNKIAACYDQTTAEKALLLAEVIPLRNPFKSRLIAIKEDKKEETKIRGWLNFSLKITAEKRFTEIILNGGIGLYNAMGMGCVEVIKDK